MVRAVHGSGEVDEVLEITRKGVYYGANSGKSRIAKGDRDR